jgi:hypothetical protein
MSLACRITSYNFVIRALFCPAGTGSSRTSLLEESSRTWDGKEMTRLALGSFAGPGDSLLRANP